MMYSPTGTHAALASIVRLSTASPTSRPSGRPRRRSVMQSCTVCRYHGDAQVPMNPCSSRTRSRVRYQMPSRPCRAALQVQEFVSYLVDPDRVFVVFSGMRNALRLTLGRLSRPWRSVLIATLLLSSESALATTFAVNSSVDAVDANPGDGICETLTGNGLCSLRGALEEAGTVQSGEATT
jgi:CSLREA domain-containing protein